EVGRFIDEVQCCRPLRPMTDWTAEAIRRSTAGAEVLTTTSVPPRSRKRASDSENACSTAGPVASIGIDRPLAVGRPGIRPWALSECSTDARVAAVGANRLTKSRGVRYWRYCGEPGALTARAYAASARAWRGFSATLICIRCTEAAPAIRLAPDGNRGAVPIRT